MFIKLEINFREKTRKILYPEYYAEYCMDAYLREDLYELMHAILHFIPDNYIESMLKEIFINYDVDTILISLRDFYKFRYKCVVRKRKDYVN